MFCHLNGELPLLYLFIRKEVSILLVTIYRPVSLTSVVAKVMESIVKTSVLEHLTFSNLLTSHQFGFLRGYSCTTQLLHHSLHVIDILTVTWSRSAGWYYLHGSAKSVWYTVPHKCLLYKIEYYGITGNLRWIAGFLSNRKKCVVLNGKQSSWQDVKSRVPQGSI